MRKDYRAEMIEVKEELTKLSQRLFLGDEPNPEPNPELDRFEVLEVVQNMQNVLQ